MEKPEQLKVFISNRDSFCEECKTELGRSSWIHLVEGKGALCLTCADLDHLEFLPPGNAALTRRANKLSTLSAVVLRWSRARNRYERQGLLVEPAALEQAEISCLADADLRLAQSRRRAERELVHDATYVDLFARAIRERYPSCPPEREEDIATHACRKHSGRVGRSADAKALDPAAVDLAVRAHVRHRETDYDQLLAQGWARDEARRSVGAAVDTVLEHWRGKP